MYDEEFDFMNRVLPFDILYTFNTLADKHPYVGCVSLIQEPGLKLRAVANPSRVIQYALEPLKDFLRSILTDIPEDCTFDQSKGVNWCQAQLTLGKTLFSVDLSDATNLFPWEIQVYVLSEVRNYISSPAFKDIFDSCVTIFKMAAKSVWRCNLGDVFFRKGQPLGLGPSFFLFALSHHYVLRSLGSEDNYRILGDDIVISDSGLASRYVDQMTRMGCSISMEKTLESGTVAEFASNLIMQNLKVKQHKWRKVTRSNAIDLARLYGPKILHELPKSIRRVVLAISDIPEQFGGLGWNPKGLSFETRMSGPIGKILIEYEDELQVFRCRRTSAVSDLLRRITSLFCSMKNETLKATSYPLYQSILLSIRGQNPAMMIDQRH
jgi:hypothetical protein